MLPDGAKAARKKDDATLAVHSSILPGNALMETIPSLFWNARAGQRVEISPGRQSARSGCFMPPTSSQILWP
jgi:hypothetical protein